MRKGLGEQPTRQEKEDLDLPQTLPIQMGLGIPGGGVFSSTGERRKLAFPPGLWGGGVSENEGDTTDVDGSVTGAKGIDISSVVNNPLGLGSTGRSTPANLNEQLAMDQAISNPAAGRSLPVPMTDTRRPAADGWVKLAQNINGIEIHYVRNSITGAIDDFKFK